MSKEYYKEIEVGSIRGMIAVLLTIAIVISLLIVPKMYAINTYSSEDIVYNEIGDVPLTNKTVYTSGDYIFNSVQRLVYSSESNPSMQSFARISNFTLSKNKYLIFNFTVLNVGGWKLYMTFRNDSYSIDTLSIYISVVDMGKDSTISATINGYSYATKNIDLNKFRENPQIVITQVNSTTLISLGNQIEYKINNYTMEGGYGFNLINSTSVIFSGNFLYYFGLNNITEGSIEIEHHHIPIIKNNQMVSLMIIFAVFIGIGIFFLRTRFLELSLLLVLFEIYFVNMGFNMTLDLAYIVSIGLIIATLSIVYSLVDFTDMESIDKFMEQHLWKLFIVWAVLTIIYLYMHHFI